MMYSSNRKKIQILNTYFKLPSTRDCSQTTVLVCVLPALSCCLVVSSKLRGDERSDRFWAARVCLTCLFDVLLYACSLHSVLFLP